MEFTTQYICVIEVVKCLKWSLIKLIDLIYSSMSKILIYIFIAQMYCAVPHASL